MRIRSGAPKAAVVALFCLFTPSTYAQWCELHELPILDSKPTQRAGLHVSAKDGVLVVSAIGDDAAQPGNTSCNSGAAYVYRRCASGWHFEQKLVAPTPACDASNLASSYFGRFVDTDGQRILIGAQRGTDIFSNPTLGMAYVYNHVGGQWVLEQTISPPPQTSPSDGFAFSGAIQGDHLAVSAYGTNDLAGAVHMYQRSGTTWSHAQVLSTGASGPQWFGDSISFSGNRVAIGAPRDGQQAPVAGAAHIFEFQGGSWMPKAKLVAPSADVVSYAAYFGGDVSLDGDWLAVGAPFYGPVFRAGAVYMFQLTSGTWSLKQTLHEPVPVVGNEFGTPVELVGSRVVAGVVLDNAQQGLVRAFDYTTTWGPGQAIQTSNGLPGDQFGSGIGLDGDDIVVGANQKNSAAGAVYAFRPAGQCDFTPCGLGCVGTGEFVPALCMGGTPKPGGAVTLSVHKGLGSKPAILLFGLSCPASPPPIGAGCFLNITPVLPLVLVLPLGGTGPGQGFASFTSILPQITTPRPVAV